MTDADPPRRKGVLGLARELVGGFVQLVRLEVTHGRQELGEMLAETRTAAVLFGVAAALGLLSLIALDLALVLGLAALFETIPDLAVVVLILATFTVIVILYASLGAGSVLSGNGAAIAILLVVTLLVAAAFAVPAYFGFMPAWLTGIFAFIVQAALAGLAALRGAQHIQVGPPQETIESVKEDIAWAKRLLRRG